MNVNYEFYYESVSGIAAGILLVTLLMIFALCAIVIVSLWKIFTKAGRPGWYSIVPFLNLWTLFEITGISGFWSLVPGANGIFLIISYFNLAERFGKDKAYGIGIFFLPYVFLPMLAFGKASYVGNNMVNDFLHPMNNNYQQPMYNQPMNNNYKQPIYNQPMNNGYQQPMYNQPMNNNYQQPMNNGYQQTTYNQQVNNQPAQPQMQSMQPQMQPVQPQVQPFQQQVEPAQPQQQNTRFCPSCGNKLSIDASSCFMCGHKF